MNTTQKYTQLLKTTASALGFDFCGVSKAAFLEKEAPLLEQWLNQGMHGNMGYMENYFDKRLDPRKLVDGAKSVVSLAYNYYPEQDISSKSDYKLSKYAYGKDYHHVIKSKLKTLLQHLEAEIGEIQGRVFVDSAPVLERAWASKSGIGWVGKNSLLLNRGMGSFFFLAELIIDVEFEYDAPVQDHCGTCTKCIDACPTDAISEAGVVNGSKCISYFTIELKEQIPPEFKGKFENWIFGCDICQDVCPWNRFSKPHQESNFNPNEDLLGFGKKEWLEMTKEVFNKVFKNSPLKRAKYAGIKRNIQFVSEGNGQ